MWSTWGDVEVDLWNAMIIVAKCGVWLVWPVMTTWAAFGKGKRDA